MIKPEIKNIDEVKRSIQERETAMREKARDAVIKSTLKVLSKTKQKLSDDVLKVQTGTLRRSINYKIVDKKNAIFGIVGTNVKYGAVHEYGFKGTAQINEHNRTISKAFGKVIDPRIVKVKAYTRKVNLPERSFLRSSLNELNDEIIKDITEALK